MSAPLRLAIQKSGRLLDGSLQLLEDCGIDIERGRLRLKSPARNFPLEIYLLRDDDIPGYVEKNLVDAGIIGLNSLAETGAEVEITERLGFARCRLSLAVPAAQPFNGRTSLEGQRIATSHPKILQSYLAERNITAEVSEISGSVEITPTLGLADLICDLVSTGSTLAGNGLREVESIFTSEAVLTSTWQLTAEKRALLDRLRFRIKAVLQARRTKYIMLNAPDSAVARITALLPGSKSPSVVPLAESGWSSIHSVVKEDDFWEVIEALKTAGAEGILVVPIEKMIS